VFCITITDLRSLTFKVAELNHFAHTPNTDRYCWKEMVHEFKKRHPQLSLRHRHAKGGPGQQVAVKTGPVKSPTCLNVFLYIYLMLLQFM
jgi:hypothetical protein